MLDFNFDRVPRFYKVMLGLQLTRARDTYTIIALLLKNMQLAIVTQQLTLTVFQLFLIVHCFGCFWYATTDLNIYTKVNWVAENGIANQPIVEKYMASMYWATVTCTTVGYGDILPLSDAAKVFTALYVLFALVIAGMAISQLVDSLANFEVEEQREALFRDKAHLKAPAVERGGIRSTSLQLFPPSNNERCH